MDYDCQGDKTIKTNKTEPFCKQDPNSLATVLNSIKLHGPSV